MLLYCGPEWDSAVFVPWKSHASVLASPCISPNINHSSQRWRLSYFQSVFVHETFNYFIFGDEKCPDFTSHSPLVVVEGVAGQPNAAIYRLYKPLISNFLCRCFYKLCKPIRTLNEIIPFSLLCRNFTFLYLSLAVTPVINALLLVWAQYRYCMKLYVSVLNWRKTAFF